MPISLYPNLEAFFKSNLGQKILHFWAQEYYKQEFAQDPYLQYHGMKNAMAWTCIDENGELRICCATNYNILGSARKSATKRYR